MDAAMATEFRERGVLKIDYVDLVGTEVFSFTLTAGEAVVHDGCMIHGGEGNRSDRMRRGWACIYFPADARYTETPVRPEAEGLGLVPLEPFDHPKFPVIEY